MEGRLEHSSRSIGVGEPSRNLSLLDVVIFKYKG